MERSKEYFVPHSEITYYSDKGKEAQKSHGSEDNNAYDIGST
jgi:hypothetical protein